MVGLAWEKVCRKPSSREITRGAVSGDELSEKKGDEGPKKSKKSGRESPSLSKPQQEKNCGSQIKMGKRMSGKAKKRERGPKRRHT